MAGPALTSRNALCPCGRGRKFKRCCGAGSAARRASPALPAQGAAGSSMSPMAVRARQASDFATRGNIRLRQADPAGAAQYYRVAIDLAPCQPALWANLGNALDDAGQAEEAVAAYREALVLRPDFAEVHNNLGLTLMALDRGDEAERHFRAAIGLVPGYAEAHFNLGLMLLNNQRPAEAAEQYRCGLRQAPGNAQALSNLGVALDACGDVEAAIQAWREASERDPTLVAARSRLAAALDRVVPAWHVPMMNDTARNSAYEQALRKLVYPQAWVFEIGTGSGLLAMMAAREGAAAVTTCEAEPLIAETAQRVIADNGLAGRIKVIAARSTELEVGRELPVPADILVSEIFSSELLGERVLASIEDARRRLLQPDARIIPAVGSIMAALVAGESLALNLHVDRVMGFDLSAFNRIVADRQTVARNDLEHDLLSDDVEVFRFDFERDGDWRAQHREVDFPVRRRGVACGVIQWLRLDMDRAGTRFENHPHDKSPASSWTRCVYRFAEPVELEAGQVVRIRAGHNRVCPWFELIGVC